MLRIRTAIFALAVAFAPALPLSALTLPDFSSLTNSISTLADQAGAALPVASSMGLDWSDAWIGSLVGVPPHFGFGVSSGFATIPVAGLQPLFDAMGNSLPTYASALGGLPVPMYTVNARIGGFVLPFDLGVKLSYMPTLTVSNLGLNYFVAGGDFRWALLQDGITPGLSVGVGVNYIQANISYQFASQSFAVSGLSTSAGNNTLELANPTTTLGLQSLSYELKAEVSKNLLLVTPYAGAAVDLSSINVNANFNGTLQDSNGATLTASQLSQLASLIPGVSVASNGITQTLTKSGIWGFRVWGGASLNIVFFKIDLKAFYALPTGNLGAELGARFQM